MEVIVAKVAAAIAAFLAPYMPYLIEGGKGFAEGMGEAAWGRAEKIWHSIKSWFANDRSIEGASLMLSANPQDENLQKFLAKALAEKLKSHPEYAEELMKLIGGQERLQDVLVENSWTGDVIQEMSGAGEQTATVKGSTTGKVIQKMT
jgi:hypothetical protein